MKQTIKFLIIFLLLSVSTAYAQSKFVGHWSWLQHTTKMNGVMSLCTGDIDVRKDGTFGIWNACKENKSDCYSIVETDGFWVAMGKGFFRAYYSKYFYDVILSGNTAFFSSMSVEDDNDIGNYEFGAMLKGVRLDAIKDFYYTNQCK